jgi:hypothetical protein
MTKENKETTVELVETAGAESGEETVVEVPVTEQETEVEQGEVLDLQDVDYMVMVGRDKVGETFFRTAGVNDLIVIRGLLEYALDEVKFTIGKHFENKGQ